MTTRNEAQNICSHRPWKIRRKTRMLPIAPSTPITAYNTATTSPPMNWLLDPAPVIRLCSSAESNFCSRSMPSGYRARAPPGRAASLDHLVCARKHRCGKVEAERFRGLEVDHQLVLGRRLHRKVGGFLALEDAIDISSGRLTGIDRIRPVG